jgi:hypothetical protein
MLESMHMYMLEHKAVSVYRAELFCDKRAHIVLCFTSLSLQLFVWHVTGTPPCCWLQH